jgi:hypothetical protein
MGSVIVDFQLRMCSYSLRVGVPFKNCLVNVVGLGESLYIHHCCSVRFRYCENFSNMILSRGSYLYHDVKYT